MRRRVLQILLCRVSGLFVICLLGAMHSGHAAAAETDRATAQRDLLDESQWKQLDSTIDRALQFLSKQQRPNGSFAAPDLGQPGITSLCVLAFLARGHVPHEGPYGEQLDRAINFVLAQQRESGILFGVPYGPAYRPGTPNQTGMYNHAIAGVMLGEVYGMVEVAQSDKIGNVLKPAIQFSLEQQQRPKRSPLDHGGWRYLGDLSVIKSDADLSVTAWQLMFLRSARNAGFDVPVESIDEAMAYVRRSFDRGRGAFRYCTKPPGDQTTRAMVGSGILSLSLGGEHETEIAKASGDWLLKHPFDRYNQVEFPQERYHYSVYYCSQGMFQLGGDHWQQFYPRLMRVLLQNQQADGSWPAESAQDTHFGKAYTTALVILALTPPYQLLPIYQR